MKPSIGRVVHYRDWGHGTSCQPAIVTALAPTAQHPEDLRARLTVFTPAGGMFSAWADEGEAESTWHWPERVEESTA